MNQSNITFKLVDSVSAINKQHWNSIQLPTLFLGLEYLHAIEKRGNEVNKFFYAIFYDSENKPIGKSVFQQLTYNAATFDFSSIPCSYGNKILQKFLNKKITLLVAGNIFATGENSYCFNSSVTNSTALAEVNKAVNQLMKADKSINYAVLKEFYPNKDNDIILQKQGYLKFNIDDNMVLKLAKQWRNFDDILLDFKTKYRQRSKKVLKTSSNLVVKNLSLSDIKTNASKLESLYQQVLKKSNFNIGVFTMDTFINLKEGLKDNYSMFGYYIDDELIGFRSSFLENANLETSFIGIDYSKNLQYNLYQRMLVDYIDFGFKHQVNHIGFGRTAEPMKSCVGAMPVSMNLYVKSRKRTGKFLLRMIVNNIEPTSYILRRPFKNKK